MIDNGNTLLVKLKESRDSLDVTEDEQLMMSSTKGQRAIPVGYFRELDGFIEEIVSLAGPKANIFIASDHGFGPTKEILYINQWLSEQGYLKWKGNV